MTDRWKVKLNFPLGIVKNIPSRSVVLKGIENK